MTIPTSPGVSFKFTQILQAAGMVTVYLDYFISLFVIYLESVA